MEPTADQRNELAALREELAKAEARAAEALSEVPEGHPLDGERLARFSEADDEVTAIHQRIREIEGLS